MDVRELPASETRAWWNGAVVYQVYLRSFADGVGDGIGDLRGLTSRMDYLAALGVDAIWLNPCYASPQRDHGYDISDYFAIDPDYGTLADFDALVAAASARGIRVLMDMVANHCSSDHEWFRAALAAVPGSPERSRFHFADGRGAAGEAQQTTSRSSVALRGRGSPSPTGRRASGTCTSSTRRSRTSIGPAPKWSAISMTWCGSGSTTV